MSYEKFINKITDHISSITQGSLKAIESDYTGSDLIEKINKSNSAEPSTELAAALDIYQGYARSKYIQNKTPKDFYEDARKESEGRMRIYKDSLEKVLR